MRTTLYLIRHGATAANLERPARLQGRANHALAPLGIRQAERTRDVLAGRPLQAVYASPLLRAADTARTIAAPHGLPVQLLDHVIECDVGRWEGLSWEEVGARDPLAYARFLTDPAKHGYPDGENFAEVAERVLPIFHHLLEQHEGQSFLVVSHHVVNRVYLASLLGLPPSQAKLVKLDNCGICVVVRNGLATEVHTVNATLHLEGLGPVIVGQVE